MRALTKLASISTSSINVFPGILCTSFKVQPEQLSQCVSGAPRVHFSGLES